ncbi:hypothetical protein PPTG_19797 [Phytophthora nicotianae INRA-310]|uniref:Uncharacterized protein n=1 Tax=Phytophthora nicotianae (strain INRA-310) TaxID=761204 RepID=W2PAM5_PHYN3|nr:hypothetical protein PPTG_19797 [Phytophthora nicotianae INRA-310]ETM98107.1 hypothetical protein PPTG_19797 [Phytophthora nicotianae INRA-310]
MISLVGVVDVKIMHELSDEKFALVFDGFTDAAEHAIAIFAATKNGIRFLAFSPFLDEASMTAAEHIEFLDMDLDHYKLDIANMVAIVADSMEANKRFPVEFRFHRLDVSALMKKLKTVKRVAKLKLHGCYYKPIPLQELRWSGCYRVLKRFEDLQPRIHLFMDDCTVEDDESDGDDSTTNPNAENLRLTTVCDIFDVVLDDDDDMDYCLAAGGEVVECPGFEAGLAKIQ